MNLVKYYYFYYEMAGRKLFAVAVLAVLGVLCQGGAGAALLTVFNIQALDESGGNMISRAARWLLGALGLEDMKARLLFLLIFACAAFVVGAAAQVGSAWYSAQLEADIRNDLQHGLFKKLFNGRYQYFLSRNIGFFNNMLINEMNKVCTSFKFYSAIYADILFFLMCVGLAALSNPPLILILGVVALPLFFVFRKFNGKAKVYSIKNTAEYALLFGVAHQALAHFKYLKSTNTFRPVLKEFRKRSANLGRIIRNQNIINSLTLDGVKPFALVVISTVIYCVVVFAHKSVAEAVGVMGVLYVAYTKLMAAQTTYQKFLQVAGGILMYEQLLGELSAAAEPDPVGKKAPDFSGGFVFDHVTYRYTPDGDDILKDVCLDIPRNSSVAFVGDSGSGKSTLVNLVTGLLAPSSGSIRLGGVDYSELNLDQLRDGIGYVTQESVIFNDSVTNNITLWNQAYTEAEVRSAAAKARADAFIQEMPGQYANLLGDGGLNISGGQRQRLTIARELLRDTPVLVLDEATSALDSGTEEEIQKSVDAYRGSKTILIIAHRLSTIRNCDVIHVLDQGRVAESGSFAALLARDGKFAEMARRQSVAAG